MRTRLGPRPPEACEAARERWLLTPPPPVRKPGEGRESDPSRIRFASACFAPDGLPSLRRAQGGAHHPFRRTRRPLLAVLRPDVVLPDLGCRAGPIQAHGGALACLAAILADSLSTADGPGGTTRISRCEGDRSSRSSWPWSRIPRKSLVPGIACGPSYRMLSVVGRLLRFRLIRCAEAARGYQVQSGPAGLDLHTPPLGLAQVKGSFHPRIGLPENGTVRGPSPGAGRVRRRPDFGFLAPGLATPTLPCQIGPTERTTSHMRKIRTLEERMAAKEAELARMRTLAATRKARAENKHGPLSKLSRAARLCRQAEKQLGGDFAVVSGHAARKIESIVETLAGQTSFA